MDVIAAGDSCSRLGMALCSALESPSDLQQVHPCPSPTSTPAPAETMLSLWPMPDMVSHDMVSQSEWGHDDEFMPIVAIDRTNIGSKTKQKTPNPSV